MRDVVIVTAVRTAVGRAVKGTLKDTRPDTLAGIVLKEAVARTPGLKSEEIDDVILGCAFPEAEQGMNVGRIASFLAGLPYTVPACTVNRFCSSGLQAIAEAAMEVMCGWADVVVAGGVESMTMIPMGGNKPSVNPALFESWPEAYTTMGITAEIVSKRFGITRQMQDELAYQSHMKAVKAQAEGKFKAEIVPVKISVFEPSKDGKPVSREVVFDVDDCPRGDTTVEKLAALKPVFDAKGTVTAGNASPINDGAAAVVVMSKEKADKLGLKPMAYFRRFVAAGTPPEIMGIGPVPAVRKLLSVTGLKLDDIDLVEINEAFAAQSVYCIKELGLPPEKTNVLGGAIALGHPLGCTGAKLTTTLVHEMGRRGARRGIVTMCIGGGMGAAALFERP